jgi:uncharacterized protein
VRTLEQFRQEIQQEFKKISTQAWLFIVLAYAGTFSVDSIIIRNGESSYQASTLVLLRMWMPGVVAIFLTLVFKTKELGQLLKKLPKLKDLGWAYAVPVLLGFLSLGLLALSGASSIGIRPELIEKYHGLSPVLMKAFVFAPLVSFWITCVACLGEELGWRGYLLPQTENLSPKFRKFFNGIVWAVYHWPLILFSDYAASPNKFYSLVMFSIFIVAQAVFICWLQERSKSLWTSVISHAAHNLWVIGIIPLFYEQNSQTPFLIGEGGVFLTIAYVVGVWVGSRFVE